MARLRDHIRNLKRRLSGTALVIGQADGTQRAFTRDEVMKHLFLARLGWATGQEPPAGPVLEALDGATDAERERVERLLEGGQFLEGLEDADEPLEGIPDLSEKS